MMLQNFKRIALDVLQIFLRIIPKCCQNFLYIFQYFSIFFTNFNYFSLFLIIFHYFSRFFSIFDYFTIIFHYFHYFYVFFHYFFTIFYYFSLFSVILNYGSSFLLCLLVVSFVIKFYLLIIVVASPPYDVSRPYDFHVLTVRAHNIHAYPYYKASRILVVCS